MASCVIRTSPEYTRLKRLSGVNDESLTLQMMVYEDAEGRLPEIDEISGADSFPVLMEDMNLKEWEYGYFGKTETLVPTGDVREANARVNGIYRDLEIKITPLDETCLVDVIKRPTLDDWIEGGFDIDIDMNHAKNAKILDSIAEKLDNQYGFRMRTFSSQDAPYIKELNGFNWQTKNAFILNGDIWINTDNASIDAPLHEMMHMLLGEMRFNDTKLYEELVSIFASTVGFRMARQGYLSNYAERDAMEEYYVTQVARYMAGLGSEVTKLPKEVRSKIDYGIKRMTNTILMGVNSAQALTPQQIGQESILSLGKLLGSTLLNNKSRMGGDMGYTHRIAMNIKKRLIQQGKLEEIC